MASTSASADLPPAVSGCLVRPASGAPFPFGFLLYGISPLIARKAADDTAVRNRRNL